ncbi:MAG: hypothetical protein R3360_07100, partial [Alphaproteobacteria bacterium]|nr:hypothetical protein [Alphaproteobacteria bacterium]
SARVVFDKPQGRIIDAQADGEVSEGEAATWYRTRLAELGWEAVVPNLTGGILVQRESEVLHIRFRQETLERLDVHYSIEPLADPETP